MERIKTWIIRMLLAIVAILAFLLRGRKPRWVEEKEKAIQDREQAIKKAREREKEVEKRLEELKVINDKEIEEIKNMPGREGFTSASDAADYINSILDRRRR